MSMPKRRPRSRALRPSAEALESRHLLSGMVTGLDSDGDRWSLRLIGPGRLNVTKQDGADLGSASQIDTITIAATDLLGTRLEGRVTPGMIDGVPGDGRVFFQNFRETDGRALDPLDPNQPSPTALINDGVLAVDLPNFWLGATATTLVAGTTPSIEIPDGVITLRFGGVDTTFTPPGGTSPNANNQSDRFEVNLGLPATRGTSIIVDRVVAGAQAGLPNAQGQPGNPTQDPVFFDVDGRINLFQANAIEFQANPADQLDTLTPDQFADFPPDGAGNGLGGTFVVSQGIGIITGQIGDARVGGNATAFTVLAVNNPQAANLGDIDAKVSNFSVGGETSNVLLVAPGGSRNVFFGRGMDQVKINSLFISHLQANRGALDSTVTVSRELGRVILGGDVVNTEVQVGYDQNLTDVALDAAGLGQLQQVQPPPTIFNRQPDGRGTFFPRAQNGGSLNVLIAGDVVNSVFSASVEPNPANDGDFGVFGDVIPLANGRMRVNDIILPGGSIHAKVEGTIDNSLNDLVDPQQADQAFFANVVRVRPGPVVPPNVPEPPYPRGGGVAPNAPRVVRGLQPARRRTRMQAQTRSPAQS